MTHRDVRLEVAVAMEGDHIVIAVNADVSLSADKSSGLQDFLSVIVSDDIEITWTSKPSMYSPHWSYLWILIICTLIICIS